MQDGGNEKSNRGLLKILESEQPGEKYWTNLENTNLDENLWLYEERAGDDG